MASLLQDLGIVEEVLGDVASFAAGQPIATTLDGYGVTVQVLPNGPTPPFTIGATVLVSSLRLTMLLPEITK